MTQLGSTGMEVGSLCLGGNVFGWTADQDASYAVLDGFLAGGGRFVDTADVYSAWVDGHAGGESETILGTWMKARGTRDQVVIATKVAKHPDLGGLAADTIRRACDASLQRLQTDVIDLYYAHEDDASTPMEETLAAFDELVRAGKVRAIAASNFSANRLEQALKVSDAEGFVRYVAVQDRYNLVARSDYEGAYADVVAAHGLASFPYSGLASGFLTGKYRTGGGPVDSPRSGGARRYLDDRGQRVLSVLDEVAAAHDAPLATVALAWLAAQFTVTAPIASARNLEQLPSLLGVASLDLTHEEITRLTQASA